MTSNSMTTIPTDLLRTFVAVVDLRSFTKAAHLLGVTQPAVSAQIKRLQQVLGTDILDKSAPGVSLTPAGEIVLNYGRRLLSINDQILHLTGSHPAPPMLRLGMPGDFVGAALWRTLGTFHVSCPDVRFHVRSSASEPLVRDVRQGELDVAMAISGPAPHDDARYHWTEEMVWVRGPLTHIDLSAPIPIVSHGEKCRAHQHVADALEEAGLSYDLAFTGSSITSLAAAVGAGLGVMALPRSLSDTGDLVVWEEGPLPRLPAIFCNLMVRAGADDVVNQLAGALAEGFRPREVLLASGSSQFAPDLIPSAIDQAMPSIPSGSA